MIIYSGMKEALNQFMSACVTNFRLSDFYPGKICQTTPPFLFAIISVDVLLSLLSAPQHSLMVCIRAHDRSCWSMTTPYQPRSPLKNENHTRRGIAWAYQQFQLARIACSGCYQADSTVCVRLLEESGSH